MKSFLLIFLALSTFCSVYKAQVPLPIPVPEETIPKPEMSETKAAPVRTMKSIEEKLNYYFLGREIRPSIIINNIYDGIRDERKEKIEVKEHTITWFHSFAETRIKIDKDLFTLRKQRTLNNVDGEQGAVDFANNWDQLRLFEYGDKELIGIKMINDPCTGLGCSVTYLIYDLKTKTRNFFGTYRLSSDREFGLFDFGNDGTVDFLSGTYVGESDGVAAEIQNIYEIFTMDDTGNFQLQFDHEGKKYFMKRVYDADTYDELDNKFEPHWPEEIK